MQPNIVKVLIALLKEEGFNIVYEPDYEQCKRVYVAIIHTATNEHRFYIVNGKITVCTGLLGVDTVTSSTICDIADPEFLNHIKKYLNTND